MFKTIRRIIAGAGYLEGYGDHPGTGVVAVSILACGLAGAQRGSWAGFFGGMAFGFIAIMPFFAIGCIDRAKAYERDVEKTFNILKKS